MHEIKAAIYVLHYKEGVVLDLPPLYTHIMAGNTFLEKQLEMQGDDSDINISAKNRYYSELTGIYWIWKNTKSDITGACHYRRFFTTQPEPLMDQLKRRILYLFGLYKKRYGLIYTSNINLFKKKILSESEVCTLLSDYDAILPIARKLKYSIEVHYKRYHDINDLRVVRTIINDNYPEFITAFDNVLQSKRIYANNMFVLKKDLFNEFMSWWFDILFEFELRIDLSTKTGYQQRILGFIAERLLNVWFMHKQLSVVELPVIYFKKLKRTDKKV